MELAVGNVAEGSTRMLTDEDCVREFQRTGDNRCYAELFLRHRKKVFFACKGFFLDTQKAEDATQETFLRAYRKIGAFQGGDFAAWLMRIARNVCIDEWRRDRLDPVVVENSELAERAAARSLEAFVEIQQRVEQIWQEIKSLSPEQRRCLELKIEGCSYEETAALIGLSVNAVKSHLQNGRRMLWRRMQAALPEFMKS
jgi:RNA polymerase sigma factor (sigma-70 family)